MRIKPALLKKVAPALSEYGFTFKALGGSNYAFINEDSSRLIIIDTDKFLPKKIRTDFQVNGKNQFTLPYIYFDPSFCPGSISTYSTQEELEQYLENAVHEMVTIIFPFLKAMEENYIESSYEMSVALSNETEKRARRFADAWKLSMEATNENARNLDRILNGMKTTPENRKRDFYQHENDIIDLSAYFGELFAIHRHKPGKWTWRQFSETVTSFVVEAEGYDPLNRVVQAWNFGAEVQNYSLKWFF